MLQQKCPIDFGRITGAEIKRLQLKRCGQIISAIKPIPDIGHAKRQTKHKAAAYFIQFQAMSAVEEARGAEGARAAEDALAARPLPKTRPMESDLTMLFITCGGATPRVTWRAISENSSRSPALQP
jgi:hypothetical protein